MKFRKKPIEITAFPTSEAVDIPTLEGTMRADVGDFIATGINGEQYSIKPNIMAQTYDGVDLESQNALYLYSLREKGEERIRALWMKSLLKPVKRVDSEGNVFYESDSPE